MRVPSARESTERLRQPSIYTSAQLAANTETKDLAAVLDTARTGLEVAEAAHQAAEDSLTAQMALRDAADAAADTAVRKFYLVTRTADGTAGGKAGPMHKRYFKDGLGAVILVPLTEQMAAMRVLAASLAEADDPEIASYRSQHRDGRGTRSKTQSMPMGSEFKRRR